VLAAIRDSLDLVRHAGLCAFGFLCLFPLYGKYMHFFGSSFSQPDIRIASVRGLKNRLPYLLSSEKPPSRFRPYLGGRSFLSISRPFYFSYIEIRFT